MNLHAFFQDRAARDVPLVLVTVFETRGSTYSKAGGQMLIDADGNFCGMLSGGCLEGDLVERARAVTESGAAQVVTYDLGADDELWGLGVGCDGTMRMLLQPLSAADRYQPYAAIAEVHHGAAPAVLATVVDSDTDDVARGAAALIRNGSTASYGLNDAAAALVVSEPQSGEPAWTRTIQSPGGSIRVFYATLERSPALLVLGAGLDSEPVVRIAAELGWRCTVVDHRMAYVDARSYPEPTRAHCCDVDRLSNDVDLSQYDMALVMSHHLASDRSYLEQLAETDIGYVGLLGPVGRRERLLGEIGEVAARLEGRLHGPAGIRLGGRGPGPIALEIVAQMQRFLADRVEVRR